jgi:hypothetical protein
MTDCAPSRGIARVALNQAVRSTGGIGHDAESDGLPHQAGL